MGDSVGQRPHALELLPGEGLLLRPPEIGDVLAGAKNVPWYAVLIE